MLYCLSHLPIVEADPPYCSIISTSMFVFGEEPCLPVATDFDILFHADHNESTGDAWVLHSSSPLFNCLCFSDFTAGVCVCVLWSCSL